MRRTTLIGLAAVAGMALAGGYLVARPDGAQRETQAAVRVTPPVVRVALDRSAKPMRVRERGIDATARIVAQEADPAGGPDWVLRTYQREAQAGGGKRVWCAQLGRMVDGEFAWVRPGKERAVRLPLGNAGTTSCAITAPISQRLGLNVGGFADGDPGNAATRVRTSVVWGVIDQDVAAASIEGRAMAGPVKISGHGFLVVRESDGAPPNVTLRVRDLDGGRRAAIPLAAFDELPLPGPSPRPVPGGPKGMQPRLNQPPPADSGRRAPGNQFVVAAKLPADRVGIVSALYAMQVPGRPPCVTSPVQTIGGRPVTSWYDGGIGLVREPQLTCQFLRGQADRRPISMGGGGSSGFDPDYPDVAAADHRQLNERRRPPTTAAITVATPEGARYLEVTTPVGRTTVRVSSARVTVVQWDGQPEVNQAMFPSYRTVRGKKGVQLGGGGVSFRALDARGKQVGAVGRSR